MTKTVSPLGYYIISYSFELLDLIAIISNISFFYIIRE